VGWVSHRVGMNPPRYYGSGVCQPTICDRSSLINSLPGGHRKIGVSPLRGTDAQPRRHARKQVFRDQLFRAEDFRENAQRNRDAG